MSVDEDVLKRALDTLDDVFYIYDATGGLVYWNRRLNELFGLTDEELSGMTATEFFEPGDRDAIEAAIEETVETGETVVEAWGQTTEGRVRFELTGRLLRDDDGTMVGLAGVGRDVTERYEQTGDLNRQNERLAEFADILAHDLRNPLSVASGHLALLRETDSSPSIDAIEAAHERMERIITDIRVATREGAVSTTLVPVDLAAVAAEAWGYVDTAGAVFEGPDELRVEADADRLLRLFENLFRNSVEHGSTGSRTESDDSVEHGSRHSGDAPTTVRLEATATGFAVEDDGPGIAPEDRDRVFAPGVSDTVDGTGFGLYIVRTIATAHGWSVSVTEGESGGARFEFDLGQPTHPERRQ
jgi:PAS domain S-box-containing protein